MGLEVRQERHVVGVRADFRVSQQRTAASPVHRADLMLRALPRWQWRTIRWRHGTKGWLRKKFVAIRCWRVTSDGHRQVGWLLGERTTRGQPEERQYHWSNLPVAAALDELADYAHRRFTIEQFHDKAKGEVGWDQYQGRFWPGFPPHTVTVMLAYSVLVCWSSGSGTSTHAEGAPATRFPLGRIGLDVPSRPCIAKWPGGCATKLSNGG
jgi:hypothetical protein